jgi:energy-coupling factor transport system ATP-binding protein
MLMSKAMVQTKELCFKYKDGKEFALENIGLTIEKGEFVGIIGSSGAGKTSLLYTMNGVIPHHYRGDFYGEVLVDGLDTVDNTMDRISRLSGSVFQDIDGQMVATLVEDEILFGLENYGIPRDEIESRVNEALEKVGITHLRYRTISSLSGGEKQKVALCAILALKPQMLLLDEPTAELDPQSSQQIFRILKELNEKEGLTVVIVEQKIMLLSEFVKRLIVMEKGKILFDDEVREVLKHSQALYEAGVNCPRVVSLSNALTQRGLYKGPAPIHLDEAETMVKEILHGKI